jgi:uncharacterized membrane protein
MASWDLHPYRKPSEIGHIVDRLHEDVSPLVHPQHVLASLRREQRTVVRFNGWLADHIVGLAGTMAFFYFLCVLMAGWSFWQGYISHDKGFDPFPFSFLFFILGGIMQSLFVPTMLTATNRTTMRDKVKDEADHRAWSHLYDVNDEQLRILRQLAALSARGEEATPAAESGGSQP